MFTHLSVRHFATVDQLELEPEPGLTVISGETVKALSVARFSVSQVRSPRTRRSRQKPTS